MVLKAYSPAGWPIIGTADNVPSCALAEVFKDDAAGDLQVEFSGESKMYWDGQYQTTDDHGRELYQDSDGGDWPAEELVFLDEDAHDHGVQLAALRKAWADKPAPAAAVTAAEATAAGTDDAARSLLARIMAELPWSISGIRQTWPHLADALDDANALLGATEGGEA